MPKSYLSDEPAAQRAKKLDFDPWLQVETRLKQMKETGHITDKVDIIVVGGTFGAYLEEYKREFVKAIFDALNGFVSKDLVSAQIFNETSAHRVVGLSVETRPDWVTEEEIKLWRELGVTKVQLGVQALDDTILRITRRGHGIPEVAEATRMCRNAGIKICYHLMPNLPGSNPEKDIEMARMMFNDPRFEPDYLKVYPAMVIPTTEMHEMWLKGKYTPYGDEELKRVLKEIKVMTPEYCRIDRLVRDISKKWVATDFMATNLRQELQKELIAEGRPCKCLRCREVREGNLGEISGISFRVLERQTLGGKELFLSYENEGKLYSMLRLRLPDLGEKILFKALESAAIIREVHTYGQVGKIGVLDTKKTQHRGLGTRLMDEAEKIAVERGYKKMAVISAIGTREYYRKFGYVLEDGYMVKVLGD